MPEPTDPLAFGQLWQWSGATPFILLVKQGDSRFGGSWLVMFIDTQSTALGEMVGLHDDPVRRLKEYERLD
jgi:hypothetical protein